MTNWICKYKAALFDLDGVVLDTEGLYSVFWGGIGKEYYPDVEDFADRIKGQTLTQIYDGWFTGERASLRDAITKRLDEYEMTMDYNYIEGAREFIEQLHSIGIKTAIVTSSNKPKMENVMRCHPELTTMFDKILTSEDFEASKPDPDCYIKAAHRFGFQPSECIVFEDSINGLKSGRASGSYVVGLATTNPREVIAPLCDRVIDHFMDVKC